MGGIFISYRQADAKAWAIALRDDLAGVFGNDRVFLDKDTLHAGGVALGLMMVPLVMRTTEEIKLRKWLTSPGPDPARNIVPPLRQKAGVGGSTPSLATMFFSDLADRPEISHL